LLVWRADSIMPNTPDKLFLFFTIAVYYRRGIPCRSGLAF
jgi:hypothetical protein